MLDLIDGAPERLRVKQLDGRGPAFAPSVTREYWAKLPERSRVCSNALLAAQTKAAAAHALRADRTFRNCSIAESQAYLAERVRAFERTGEVEALAEALAALHAFYAYSNYTEVMNKAGAELEDVMERPIELWAKAAPPNLVSDVSAQASPSRCRDVAPQIDKSSPKGYGATWLEGAGWELPAHEAAIQLAMADTNVLLGRVLKKQKEFSEKCGSNIVVAFIARWF